MRALSWPIFYLLLPTSYSLCARLELAHLRVLAAAAEEAGRLDAEVAKLLPATVDHGEGERLLEAIPLRL